MRYFIVLISTILSCHLISGCTGYDASSSTPSKAQEFLEAVNTSDIDALVALSAAPLTSYNQAWETTPDGIGFSLAPTREVEQVSDLSKLPAYFIRFVDRVNIQGKKATLIPERDYANFKEELGDTINQWNGLDIYFFLRGEADVEHILLIGIQASNNKIRAIYTN